MSHVGSSPTRSKRTSTTSRSNPVTAKPVAAPTSAARSTTRCAAVLEPLQAAYPTNAGRRSRPTQRPRLLWRLAGCLGEGDQRGDRRLAQRRPVSGRRCHGSRHGAPRSRRRRSCARRRTTRSSSLDGCCDRPHVAPVGVARAGRTTSSPSTGGCPGPRRDHRRAADPAQRARRAPGTAATSRRPARPSPGSARPRRRAPVTRSASPRSAPPGTASATHAHYNHWWMQISVDDADDGRFTHLPGTSIAQWTPRGARKARVAGEQHVR